MINKTDIENAERFKFKLNFEYNKNKLHFILVVEGGKKMKQQEIFSLNFDKNILKNRFSVENEKTTIFNTLVTEYEFKFDELKILSEMIEYLFRYNFIKWNIKKNISKSMITAREIFISKERFTQMLYKRYICENSKLQDA